MTHTHNTVLSRLLSSNAEWAADVGKSQPHFFEHSAKGQSPKVRLSLSLLHLSFSAEGCGVNNLLSSRVIEGGVAKRGEVGDVQSDVGIVGDS